MFRSPFLRPAPRAAQKAGIQTEGSEGSVETRWASTDAEERRRAVTGDDVMNTPASVTGIRGRALVGATEYLDAPPRNQKRRCRVDARRSASVADKEVVTGYAQWRRPEVKSRVGATRRSVAEGVGAATSARVAEKCNHELCQELTEEGAENALRPGAGSR